METSNRLFKDRHHYAAHQVIAGSQCLEPAVVDVENGKVIGFHQFAEEEPFTEWVGGTIHIKEDKQGILRAYLNDKQLC